MENSKNEIVHPFDIECKFKKADLIALKESENGFLSGKCFYAFNIPGLQYFIRIYPYGNIEKRRGETWIFFHLNGTNERNITAKFTISVESANYSKSFNYVYQAYKGWGESCCKTADFFETKNKYFIDGKIIIKVKATLKTDRLLIQKISNPVSMQWKIKEEILKAKKELQNEYLRSKRKIITSFCGVKYYLSISPNEVEDGEPPKTGIYLNIEMENEKKIEAVFNFSVDSVNFNCGLQYAFEKSGGQGISLCLTDDLFDPLKGYFIDGILTINFNGILLTETNENIELNAKKRYKDFTIVVGDKDIKVQKEVLIKVSPVMAAMFESGLKESDENKMIIEDFPFEIVDEAVNLCYNSDILPNFILEDKMLLYRFADKYEIKSIMDLVENDLIKIITPSNVVQLIHFSKNFNETKLYQSCINFLLKCSEAHTSVLGIESLDDHFLAMRFLDSLCPVDFDAVDSDDENSDEEDSDDD